MPVIASSILDFSRLQAPTEHGGVLIEPEPGRWIPATRANNDALRVADTPLLDSTLAVWRRITREAIVGRDDCLVIVTGHQPAFIHPGVWAKHIVAARLAEAVGGAAVNLIVDSDAVKQGSVAIPSEIEERLTLRHVRFAEVSPGQSYEQIAAQSPHEVARLAKSVREALGDRYGRSQMPAFLGAMARAGDARDWVDQAVAARRTVEAKFGVVLEDQRVSDLRCNPLMVDIFVNAPRFAASHNRALAEYRVINRVRGRGRPVPDLIHTDDRCEVPVWIHRAAQPRRRLFVARAEESLRLFADDSEIGTIPLRCMDGCESLADGLKRLDGWQLRPRALMLTIWARLLLADLFIHGIGGAKYDRISDSIVADYYRLTPPHMACASATLHLDLPTGSITPESIHRQRHELRGLQHNPQRHLLPDRDLEPLIARRADAVRRSIELRSRDRLNRRARRSAFKDIRESNAAMLALRAHALPAKRDELAAALREAEESTIARGREYFFCLYDEKRLEQLIQALPSERDFRV